MSDALEREHAMFASIGRLAKKEYGWGPKQQGRPMRRGVIAHGKALCSGTLAILDTDVKPSLAMNESGDLVIVYRRKYTEDGRVHTKRLYLVVPCAFVVRLIREKDSDILLECVFSSHDDLDKELQQSLGWLIIP